MADKMEEHREALRALNRRELQARAKDYGVRANGKTVDIIEALAALLSGQHEAATGGVGSEDGTDVGNDVPMTGDMSSLSEHANVKEELALDHVSRSEAAGSSPLDHSSRLPAAATESHPGPETLPYEKLAARASASALAASLTNMKLDSILKSSSIRVGSRVSQPPVQPIMDSTPELSPVGSPPGSKLPEPVAGSSSAHVSAQEPDQPLAAPLVADLVDSAMASNAAASWDPVTAAQRLPFGASTAPAGSKGADEEGRQTNSSSADGATVAPLMPCGTANISLAGGVRPLAVKIGSTRAVRVPISNGSSNQDGNRQLQQQQHPKTENMEQRSPSSAGAPGTPGPAFAPPAAVSGVATPSLFAPAAAPGHQKLVALHVTGRTPLRQERMMNITAGPAQAPAGTPLGRAGGGLCGTGLPRTPGLGLRTPARRVPVCTDEAQARVMDEWVEQHLLQPAGRPASFSWREFEGLDDAKQRLKDIYGPSAAAVPALLNASVLLYGPPGMGKSLLARALAAEMGAVYLHLPPDLASWDLPAGGGAEGALRAVFRVASRAPGPVLLHVEDVDELAGTDMRQSEGGRRLRTELLVGVDELLLQSPAQEHRSPGAAAAAGASPSAACGGKGARAGGSHHGTGACQTRGGKVLVLSTTSRPMDLDAGLAAGLGRTDHIKVALPDMDAREVFLVGRLAAEGAAVGVEHVERLARQTEGMSFAEIKKLCDRATAIAAARQGGAGSCGTVMREQDLAEALTRADLRTDVQWLAELEQWHGRMDALASGKAGSAFPALMRLVA